MCGSEAFFAPFAFGMVTAIFGLIVALILAHVTEYDSEKNREKPDFHSD